MKFEYGTLQEIVELYEREDLLAKIPERMKVEYIGPCIYGLDPIFELYSNQDPLLDELFEKFLDSESFVDECTSTAKELEDCEMCQFGNVQLALKEDGKTPFFYAELY